MKSANKLEDINSKSITYTYDNTVNSVINYYHLSKSRVYVTSKNNSITSEQLIQDIESKYGNFSQIEAFLRQDEVGPTLDSILKGEEVDIGMPVPAANDYAKIHQYIESLSLNIASEYLYKMKPLTPEFSNEVQKRTALVDYLYSLYFEKSPIQVKAFSLKIAKYYFSAAKRKDLVTQMTEDDWFAFKYNITNNYEKEMTSQEADILARAIEDVIRYEGEYTSILLNRPDVEFNAHVLDILEHAILHGKTNVINSAIQKYLASSFSVGLKLRMEKDALTAMTEGDQAIAMPFLNPRIWNSYHVDTRACIIALISTRFDDSSKVPLFQYLASEHLISDAVIDRFADIYDGEDKQKNIDDLRAIANSKEYHSSEVAKSRHLSGSVFITPRDGTISPVNLIAKAEIYGDHVQRLAALKQHYAAQDLLTNAILFEKLLVSRLKSSPYKQRYIGVESFNTNALSNNRQLRNIAEDSVLLDKCYSTYLNSHFSAKIDPVIMLIALKLPELIGQQKMVELKDLANDDRAYLKYAATRMYENIFPSPVGGEIIEDLIYGNGKKTLNILKANELFGGPELIALRFAVLHEKTEVVEYLMDKYISTTKSHNLELNIHKGVGDSGLEAIIRGNFAICKPFLHKEIWGYYEDFYRAQIVNLIITRSGMETRNDLMDHLRRESLLTKSLTEHVHKSSAIKTEQGEINAFYNPIYDRFMERQHSIDNCKASNRKLDEILSEVAKKENRKYVQFAELAIACQKEFAQDKSKWNSFIESNINKLISYSSITTESFKIHFGEQDFFSSVSSLIDGINIAVLSKPDKSKDPKKKIENNASNKASVQKLVKAEIVNEAVVIKKDNILLNLGDRIITKEEVDEFLPVSKNRKDTEKTKNRQPNTSNDKKQTLADIIKPKAIKDGDISYAQVLSSNIPKAKENFAMTQTSHVVEALSTQISQLSTITESVIKPASIEKRAVVESKDTAASSAIIKEEAKTEDIKVATPLVNEPIEAIDKSVAVPDAATTPSFVSKSVEKESDSIEESAVIESQNIAAPSAIIKEEVKTEDVMLVTLAVNKPVEEMDKSVVVPVAATSPVKNSTLSATAPSFVSKEQARRGQNTAYSSPPPMQNSYLAGQGGYYPGAITYDMYNRPYYTTLNAFGNVILQPIVMQPYATLVMQQQQYQQQQNYQNSQEGCGYVDKYNASKGNQDNQHNL